MPASLIQCSANSYADEPSYGADGGAVARPRAADRGARGADSGLGPDQCDLSAPDHDSRFRSDPGERHGVDRGSILGPRDFAASLSLVPLKASLAPGPTSVVGRSGKAAARSGSVRSASAATATCAGCWSMARWRHWAAGAPGRTRGWADCSRPRRARWWFARSPTRWRASPGRCDCARRTSGPGRLWPERPGPAAPERLRG